MSGNYTGQSWAWDSPRTSGYTYSHSYPSDAHAAIARNHHAAPWPVRTPIRRRPSRLTVATVAVTAGIAALAALAILTTPPPGTGAPTLLPVTGTLAPAAATTATLGDPYRDTGDWLIGTHLPPGVYRVTATGETGGYWARCADEPCEQGAGMLENRALPRGTTGLLHLLASDHKVRTHGIELIPA